MLQREGSDAEVAAAPRPADPAQAARRLRRRPHAAPADLRNVADRHSAEIANMQSDVSADSADSTRFRLQLHRVVERDLLDDAQRRRIARRRCRPARAAPAAPRARARAGRVVRRDEAGQRAGAIVQRSRRSTFAAAAARARTGPAATARRPGASRRRAGSSSRRVSANPPTVASSHGITMCAAGRRAPTARRRAASRRAASATSARAPPASASGAEPNSRARGQLQLADAALDELALRRARRRR